MKVEEMRHNLDIRVYNPSDLDKVVHLWKACKLVVPWNNPEEDIRRKMQIDPELFLVGEMEGKIVATVMGGYEGHRGWINYLAVAPQFQRYGFGAQIMREVEARIKARGCPKINLQVRTRNTDVINFYESIGYRADDVVSLGKRLIED